MSYRKFRQIFGTKFIVLSLGFYAFLTGTISAQNSTELDNELELVDEQLVEVEETIKLYGDGLISLVARNRKEMLLLLRTAIQLRQEIDSNNLETKTVFPITEPNLEKASQIQQEIVEVESRISQAEIEASQVGGLIQALALSRVETEKNTLAQLRMAYIQEKYGIVFSPNTQRQSQSLAESNDSQTDMDKILDSEDVENESELPSLDSQPQEAVSVYPWADPNFPEIDYSRPLFSSFYNDNYFFSGWWSIRLEKALIDDSPEVYAINLSNYEDRSFVDQKTLIAGCIEGSTRILYSVNDFLWTDLDQHLHEVTYRIDSESAQKDSWSISQDSQGVLLFDIKAKELLKQLYSAQKLFLRVIEKRGETHDALFDLSGIKKVIEHVADACNWTIIELNKDQYRKIQSFLNLNGFDAGTNDGVWGKSSKSALRQFQEKSGLEATGIPNKETLELIGID